MGKKWDNSGIAYDVQLWTECLRVLKPGGHLLAFGGTRTYHRMACAIEDAGFEIRDSIHWLYGSGFPKSLDVSKALDKAAGAQREVVGKSTRHGGGKMTGSSFQVSPEVPDITAPATDAAKQWAGWGTALKPAHEPIVVARKPFAGTVAANVLEHGTGALNIDGARIGRAEGDSSIAGNRTAKFGTQETKPGGDGSGGWKQNDAGRWPANVITDGSIDAEWVRYFYAAKPSKRERNAGLDGLPKRDRNEQSSWVRECGVCGCRFTDPTTGKPKCKHDDVKYTPPSPTKNFHPTVKPLALMRYLVRLVTPPGGTVLEPFAGSGTTLAAAILEGFDVIGCELTDDYLPIIEGRIAWAEKQMKPDPESLFNQ